MQITLFQQYVIWTGAAAVFTFLIMYAVTRTVQHVTWVTAALLSLMVSAMLFYPSLGGLWLCLFCGAALGAFAGLTRFARADAVTTASGYAIGAAAVVLVAKLLMQRTEIQLSVLALLAGTWLYGSLIFWQVRRLEQELSILRSRYRSTKKSHDAYHKMRQEIADKLGQITAALLHAPGTRYGYRFDPAHNMINVTNQSNRTRPQASLAVPEGMDPATVFEALMDVLGSSPRTQVVVERQPRTDHVGNFLKDNVLSRFEDDRRGRSAAKSAVRERIDKMISHMNSKNVFRRVVVKLFFPSDALWLDVDKKAMAHPLIREVFQLLNDNPTDDELRYLDGLLEQYRRDGCEHVSTLDCIEELIAAYESGTLLPPTGMVTVTVRADEAFHYFQRE